VSKNLRFIPELQSLECQTGCNFQEEPVFGVDDEKVPIIQKGQRIWQLYLKVLEIKQMTLEVQNMTEMKRKT
jgi:hypothetical protein